MKGPYLGVGLLAFYCAASAQYTIHTVAGGGPPDGTLATDVGMVPYGIAVDPSGNVYIASSLSNRIFKISPGGRLTTLAGNGGRGYSGDGGPAAQAQLQNPRGLAMDSSGNLYIADSSNDRIRKISSTGVITTVAGGGSSLGDGGPATGASLLSPSYVAVDQAGNL
jgi:sugar lactone lactonase YvrE